MSNPQVFLLDCVIIYNEYEKNEMQRYDANWTKPRHGHKYTKYKMCLSMVMFMCISNT